MIHLKINKSKKDRLIYITFCIYLILQLISITSVFYGNEYLSLALRVCRYLCYSIFMFRIIDKRHKISKIELTLLAIVILVYLFSKSRTLLITLIILMALKDLDLNRLLKICYKTFVITFVFIVTFSILKIIPDWTYIRGNIIRHSLGFFYPTDCSSIFLMISLLCLYINKFNTSWYQIILIEIINIMLFVFTNGRLSFILINIIVLTMILLKISFVEKLLNKKETIHKMKTVSYILPSFFLILTNALILLMPTNNLIINKTDLLLSHRISNAERAYEKYGIHLFGKNIEWFGWAGYGYIEIDKDFEYNYVDNSYAKILLNYGIVFTMIVIYAYTKLLLYACDKKNSILYLVIVFVLIWSFVEPYIINISRNVFVVTFILLLSSNANYSRWLHEKINQKKLHL